MFLDKLFGKRASEQRSETSTPPSGFGRKVADAAIPPPQRRACDRFLDRTDKTGTSPESGERYCADDQVMMAALQAMSSEERGDLVASMIPLAEPPVKGRIYHDKLKRVLECALKLELPPRADVVETLIAIGAQPTNRLTAAYANGDYIAYLRAAKAAGIAFNDAQRATLVTFAERAMAEDATYWGKDYERRNRKGAHAFYELADAVPKGEDLLAKRTSARPSPNRFRPLPESADFWCAFLDQVAAHAELVRTEVTQKELPDWTRSPDAFHARFVSVAGMPFEFGFWERPELSNGLAYDWGNFWAMRSAPPQHRGKLDLPTLPGTALRTLREQVSPLAEVEWGREWVPAADVLLGDNGPDDSALLLHLIGAPDGPLPPVKWRKEAQRLAGKIGPEIIQQRALAWLAWFHTPGASKETLAELALCHARCQAIAAFDRAFPHWLALEPADVDRLAEWVAVVSVGYNTTFSGGIENFFRWYNKVAAPREAIAGFRYADSDTADRMLDYKLTHVVPTTENERVLRGVVWLLGLTPECESITTLERTAIAATALKRLDNYRSRTTANAAIATLGQIGTPGALEALGRLRRAINDKAIGNAVQKAMAVVAGRLGVAVDDVAEMSVPDYGLG